MQRLITPKAVALAKTIIRLTSVTGTTPTQTELAKHFGVTPQVISRRLFSLKCRGIVDYEPYSRYCITVDREKLQAAIEKAKGAKR